MEEKKQINDEELEKVSSGLGFGSKTCPQCGTKVAVMYEQQGPFKVIVSGQCKCGYKFGNY